MGAWHPEGTEINRRHLYEQMSTLRDALVAALTLDTFHRHADKVGMANVAQLVNNLHSLFLADGDKFVATPNFHVFEMYKSHQGGKSVRVAAQSESVEFGKGGKVFRVAGSASVKDRNLVVTLVHTHASEPLEIDVRLKGGQGEGTGRIVLTNESLNAHNTFESPEVVMPKPMPFEAKGGTLRCTLPPASVTRLDVRLI